MLNKISDSDSDSEKGSSDFSRKIINEHTIFFIINVNCGTKFETKLY